MIAYHGTPLTPDRALIQALTKRHAMVSFWRPDQVATVAEVCQSFALDNGAFSAWKHGTPIRDWTPYAAWADEWLRHPGCDWVVIPDVIDGSEQDNDDLIAWWRDRGMRDAWSVPVWHLHESIERLARLVAEWPRVALGSSGAYATVGTDEWWARMAEAMAVACDAERRPKTKLHGLRMLNPTVLSHLPLASADSTMVARNIGIDQRWRGTFTPASKGVRAAVLVDRIEHHAVAARWSGVFGHQMNFELLG